MAFASRASVKWGFPGLGMLFAVWINDRLCRAMLVDRPRFFDTGWFMALVYRSGGELRNPDVADSVRSFHGVHVSGLLVLASKLSEYVRLGRGEWFSLFSALPFGLLAGVVWFAVGSPRSWREAYALVSVQIFASLFGFSVLFAEFPHFEFYEGVGLAFLAVCLSRERHRLALLAGVLVSLVREDGALHAMLFVLTHCAIQHADVRSRVLRLYLLHIVVLVVFLAGCLAFKSHFPGPSLARGLYLGDPPFAHWSLRWMGRRMVGVVTGGTHVIFFALGVIGLVWRMRRVESRLVSSRLFACVLASVPWLLANIFAADDTKCELGLYLSFPLVGSMLGVVAYARHLGFGTACAALAALIGSTSIGLELSHVGAHARNAKWLFGSVASIPELDELEQSLGSRLNGCLVDSFAASWVPNRTHRKDEMNGADLAQAPCLVFNTRYTSLSDHDLDAAGLKHCAELAGRIYKVCGREP